MSAVIIDPEFKSLIPPLSADERDQLRANIQSDGKILEPLAVWKKNRILLDGHNRQEIADELGLPYRTNEIDLPDRSAAIEWIINHQFGRRNITDMVRSELALKLKPIVAAKASEREKSGKNKRNDPGQNSAQGIRAPKTSDIVARAAGVSRDTIAKAEKIQEKATPALLAATRAGHVSIHAAAQAADLPAEEQDRIAAAESPSRVLKEAKSKPASPTKDGQPWDEWNGKVKAECHAISVACTNLAKLIGVEKQGHSKHLYAYFMPSNDSTFNLIREGIDNITKNLPAAPSAEQPGFISVNKAKMLQRVQKGKAA